MFNPIKDRDFLLTCINMKDLLREYEKNGISSGYNNIEMKTKPNEYVIHAGYINFYVDGVLHIVPDFPAFEKYLQSCGYTYNPRTDIPIRSFSDRDVVRFLHDLGPASWVYRHISFFTNEKFEKEINNLETVNEIRNYLHYHVENNAHFNPNRSEEYLRSGKGRNSILSYANSYNLNYYDWVDKYIAENFGPECAFNISRNDMNPFEHFYMQLERIPYEYFTEILEKVNAIKRGQGNHQNR